MYTAGTFSVPFPFKPYPLQLHAMEAIRSGLAAGDVVVLESPTGTGKTQVLLNGVLSHVFEPHMQTKEDAAVAPSVVAGAPTRWRKRRRESGAGKSKRPTSDGQDTFLLEQDGFERQGESDVMSLSSSSSSSFLVDGGEEEYEEDDGNGFGGESDELRKPKVYFCSRTHTQLQQLTEELRRTLFTQHLVSHCRQNNNNNNISLVDIEKQVDQPSVEAPRSLRYVHVAGRQQLCLNASLRAAAGNSNERLNELCLEAMAYEYSKEGIAARKEQKKGNNLNIFVADIEDGPSVRDLTKGCSYCCRERLKILKDYVNIAPRGLLEMRELGQRVNACPFLVTRELVRSADVVLIPYSYLVSPEMRHTLLSGSATNEHMTQAEMDDYNDGLGHQEGHVSVATSVHYTRGMVTKHKRKKNVAEPLLPPNFSGDIVVVDEAHNLVDFCRQATSAAVTLYDLALVRNLFEAYYNTYERRLLTRNKQRLREIVSFIDKLIAYMKVEAERFALGITQMVSNFSSFLFDAGVDTVNVYRFIVFLDESRLLVKLHCLVNFFALNEQKRQRSSGVGVSTNNKEGTNIGLCGISYSDNCEQKNDNSFFFPLLAHDDKAATRALRRFDVFLRWYSRSDEHTRVLLQQQSIATGNENKEDEGSKKKNEKKEDAVNVATVQLQLLQLEPGTNTIFPVLRQAQAVVLAGGTMKPLALTCDLLLKRPFQPALFSTPVSLKEMDSCAQKGMRIAESSCEKEVRFTEEGHIVPPSSFALFALGVGPSGHRVELQHSTRDKWQRHFDEIAAALLNFCRIVPAGIVVFFTSYEVEELFVGHLQRSGMYDKINEVKRIFREPGRLASAGTTKRVVTAEGSASSNNVEALLEEYAFCIRAASTVCCGGCSGALLFAVMGGKLSEGINFNDDLGRAVVVVGLPYANPTDVELQLHLNHIATTRLLLTESGSVETKQFDVDTVKNDVSVPSFSTAQWGLFTDLCMRTVNQCIGRCIRHSADYAVIILFDARYVERADIRRRIASWMQPSITAARNFGECFRGVRHFFSLFSATPKQ